MDFPCVSFLVAFFFFSPINKDIQHFKLGFLKCKLGGQFYLIPMVLCLNKGKLKKSKFCGIRNIIRARSLVVSDPSPETKGSRFESGRYLCAEVSFLQQSPS